MSALARDAHRAVKEAGFDPTRAEAVAAAVADATTGTVAARADVVESRADVKADVAALDAGTSALQADRAAPKRDVADLEAEVAGSRVDGSATKAGLHRLAFVSSVAVVGPTVAPTTLIP